MVSWWLVGVVRLAGVVGDTVAETLFGLRRVRASGTLAGWDALPRTSLGSEGTLRRGIVGSAWLAGGMESLGWR